jgi:hypothetical protein
MGGEHGIVELGDDLTVKRTLSVTPARLPRYLDGARDLVFLTRDLRELHRLVNNNEKVVAKLPRSFRVCDGTPDVPAGKRVKLSDLDVQSADDFAVSEGVACIVLQDRNDNMMSLQAVVRVTLATGKVTASCAGNAAVESCVPSTAPSTPTPTLHDAPPFHIGDGKLSSTTAKSIAVDPELAEETDSPSGRWVVASALLPEEEQGDYIYRRLLLFDRKTGHVFPLHAGAWPPPLKPAQLKNLTKLGDRTITAYGESTIVWLAGDRLFAAGLLVTPGVGAAKLEGDPAQ